MKTQDYNYINTQKGTKKRRPATIIGGCCERVWCVTALTILQKWKRTCMCELYCTRNTLTYAQWSS